MPIDAARVIIEVVAGVLPGTPMPEYTRRWGITSGEWYGPENTPGWNPEQVAEIYAAEMRRRVDLLAERYKLATDYANQIMNPVALNWIRVEWIWL